jgi:hypothetical protein
MAAGTIAELCTQPMEPDQICRPWPSDRLPCHHNDTIVGLEAPLPDEDIVAHLHRRAL